MAGIGPILGAVASLVGAFMQPEAPEMPPLPPSPELPKVYAPTIPNSADVKNQQAQYETDIAKRTKAGLLDNDAPTQTSLVKQQTGSSKQGILASASDTSASAITEQKKTLLGS